MMRIPTLIASLLLLGANAGAQERFQPVAKDAIVFSYKIHYLEAGQGEPVILLHGSGGEGARWMPQIEALSKDYWVPRPSDDGLGKAAVGWGPSYWMRPPGATGPIHPTTGVAACCGDRQRRDAT